MPAGFFVTPLEVSSLAVVMASASLAWQFVSWRRTGPRVVVTAHWSIRLDTSEEYVSVRATNSGRLETVISQFGFELPKNQGQFVRLDGYIESVEMPAKLSPGAEVSYSFHTGELRNWLAENGSPNTRPRPYVVTGHGRKVGKPYNRLNDE